MQPTRRSSRLSERGTSTPAPSAARPFRPSRKRIRKQRREITPPPSSPPAAYTSSSSTNDEVEPFQPKEPRYQASRSIFQARNQENPEMLRSNITLFSSRFVTSNLAESMWCFRFLVSCGMMVD
ncbi:hypothetical protein YC2023_085318 [Brassica napus]